MKEKICVGIIGGQSGEILAKTAKKRGLKTVLIAGKDTEAGTKIADESYVIDLKNKEEIVNLLMEKVDCVCMGTGHKFAHAIAKELFDKGMPISIEPYNAEIGKNKMKAYEKFKELGYKVPGHRIIKAGTLIDEKLMDGIKLPVVVKSISDEVKTSKAVNKDQLRSLLVKNMEKNSDVIVDEFIDGLNATIPVVSDGEKIEGLRAALDMVEINKMAIDGCPNFEVKDTYLDERRDEILTDEVKNEIVAMTEDIVRKIGLIGVPRFDLIIKPVDGIYILEVNEVAVSALGPTHFPWEQVDISMADEMMNVTLKVYEKSKRI